jgi:NCS2 family nucleobase:cation symporter-2/xanthine permease XanP
MDRFALPDLAASNLSFLTPEALPFGFGIEPVMVLIMMPIFIVSATESIGDLTATNRLSGHCHGDESYWLRIRGGLMGDSLNSGLASVLGTFPNTTFSQNNGVIRATGASNPVIGIYAAVVLIGLGLLPTTVAWIQAIPETVVKGMTLILFSLVVFAGFSLVRSAAPRVYDYVGVVIAGVMGIAIAETISEWSFLPAVVISTFSFSVTNAALLMILIDRALKRIR